MKIKEHSGIQHARQHFRQYIRQGSSPNPLIKSLIRDSRAASESPARVAVTIDTKAEIISVMKAGSCFPAGEAKNLRDDPLIQLVTRLDDREATAIRLPVIYSFSDWVVVETCKGNKKFSYYFIGQEVTRETSTLEDSPPFTSVISFKPSARFFPSFNVDAADLSQYLKVFCAREDAEAALILDGKKQIFRAGRKSGTKATLNANRRRKAQNGKTARTPKPEPEVEPNKKSRKKKSKVNWMPKGRIFTEVIYAQHLGKKAMNLGDVAIVYGRTEEEVLKRVDTIARLPELVTTLQESFQYISELPAKGKDKRLQKRIQTLLKEIGEPGS